MAKQLEWNGIEQVKITKYFDGYIGKEALIRRDS